MVSLIVSTHTHPGNGTGEWATRNWRLYVICGNSDWIERQVFPANDNRCQQSHESHDRRCCGRDQSQDDYFTLCRLLVQVGCSCGTGLQCEFIMGHPSCVAVHFIFVVGLQFLLYIWHKLQRFVVTDFIYIYMYMHVLVCFMQLRNNMQHGCVFDSVTVLFIPLWKLSFLHMCWT